MTDIGVLLPLRLETRFDQRGATWWLRLRVVPDEPWYDRREKAPSAAELAALRHFAETAGPPTQPAALLAWRSLAAGHGPSIAWWLVRTYATWTGSSWQVRDTPIRDQPGFPAVSGFPGRLKVWLARGGAAPIRAADLTVAVDRLTLDLPESVDQRRWWLSWPEAVAVGLGVEISLGARADDIDAVYVTGLGTADRGTLLGAHVDAGRLGLLAPGTPTNSVDGGRTVDADTDQWWAAYQRGTASGATGRTAAALTGPATAWPALPGEPSASAWPQLMTALWPALVGHTLRDLAGFGPAAYQLGDVLAAGLAPEGPYPALRVGSQPYGILPVSALASWRPAATDPAVLTDLVATLRTMRSAWVDAAVRRGTVSGAGTATLIDLIAQPARSPGFVHRSFLPLELFTLAMLFVGEPADPTLLAAGWDAEARPPGVALRPDQPVRRYASRDHAHPLDLPLVRPAGMTNVGGLLKSLADAAADPGVLAADNKITAALGIRPDSLLLQLAIWSLRLAAAALGQKKAGQSTNQVLIEPLAVPDQTKSTLLQYVTTLTKTDLANSAEFQKIRSAVRSLAGADADDLARLLTAAVDTVSHRLDVWLTALPAQRLDGLVHAAGTRWRLGAYGWVDQPRPGRPGPTTGGLLHAPSESQVMTAAILRDRAVTDPEADRWAMSVTSDRVRRAADLADQVRAGAHPGEALGRMVERLVGDPAAIAALRRDFPLRSAHDGRRTCDGAAVLAAEPSDLSLPKAALSGLDELRAAVDTYGDLTLADAVYQVIEGRAASAGASLDAAAGLGRPPALDVLRTRREGRTVTSTALLVLPDAAPTDGTDWDASPATWADPAVAAWLTAHLDTADQWLFSIGAKADTVGLDELGLAPADALALTAADLRRLVIAQVGGGTDPDARPEVGGDALQRHAAGLRMIGVLGTVPSGSDRDALVARLRDLYEMAKALVNRLAGGKSAAVRAATRWGIVAPDGADPARYAADILRARLAALSDLDAVTARPPDELVRAIRALVAPDGAVGVLGRLRRRDLPTLTRLDDDGGWLTTVAPVRPALARLEAHRYTAAIPTRTWSNRPSDIWQARPEDPAPLLMAYLPDGFEPERITADSPVAVGQIDQFSELVPAPGHTTHAAFGYDGPAARAPQAVLLAVPPDPSRALDDAGLVDVVADARLLARVRMATPAELDGYRTVLPTVLLPDSGPFTVKLEATP